MEGFKKAMAKEVEKMSMGLMRYFFGLEIKQQASGIFITQKHYAKKLGFKKVQDGGM